MRCVPFEGSAGTGRAHRAVMVWWLALFVVLAAPDDRLEDARAEVREGGASGPLDVDLSGSLDGLPEPDACPLSDGRCGFLRYPYADGRPGYMVERKPGQEETSVRDQAVRVSAEGAYLYGDVWRSSAQLRLLAPSFYFQARYDFLLEGPTPVLDHDLEIQDTVRDRLHFANVEAGCQLFSGPKVAGRLGVAGVLMIERPYGGGGDVIPAVLFVSELDAYPIRPLVLSARAGLGRFVGGAMLLEARATVGASLRNVELFAGYDHRQIGRVHLGGPTVGLAVRF